MSSTVSLSAYTIQVYDIKNKEYLDIDRFFPNTKLKLSNVLVEYLNCLANTASHNQETQRLLRVKEHRTRNQSIIGVIETGEYGYESDLFNVDQSTVAHRRKTTEAELLPFYFNITVPRTGDTGIVLLQRFGIRGIKTIFYDFFSSYFTDNYSQYRIDMASLVPRQLIEQYLKNGHINSVKFIRYRIPKTIEDQFDHPYNLEEGTMELTIKAKYGRKLPLISKIQQVLENSRRVKDFLSIENFEYDSVKVQLDIGGKIRTLDLENPAKIRASFDITDKIIQGTNGHPTFESIDFEAQQLIAGILDSLGIEGVNV